jgi:hypothetical protein
MVEIEKMPARLRKRLSKMCLEGARFRLEILVAKDLAFTRNRHCEERKRRSNPAFEPSQTGLLLCARNDDRHHRLPSATNRTAAPPPGAMRKASR